MSQPCGPDTCWLILILKARKAQETPAKFAMTGRSEAYANSAMYENAAIPPSPHIAQLQLLIPVAYITCVCTDKLG